MRMKYCPHLPAFIDQLRTGVNNVVSHGIPWIAIVIWHVLSWECPGCLLTVVFSRPYSEWNSRDVSSFTKLNFYPLLKWQTGVWSLQLCHCEFASRTLYDCFHFVLGSIWNPVHTIVPTLSRKSMNNEPNLTETIEALCGAVMNLSITCFCGDVPWTCWHDVLLWSCVVNLPITSFFWAVSWT
jgi:hypothetical protein